jgi:putative membrane protein
MIIESFISVLRGFAMGAADIVPGVSGGTIALVLGFYERLVASVRSGSSALGAMVRGDFSGFKSWLGKVEWALIIPLLVGILVAIVSLAHIIEELLHEEPVAMASLFVGLVAGSMVIAWMMLKRPVLNHVWIALAVGVAVFLILGLRSGTSEESVNQLADPALWAFFASGAVAICATILPGISGSFVLVMLGMYGAVLGAVTDRDLVALGVFAIGAIVGLGLFSQFLHRALTNHHDAMLAGLIGLMGGSLRVLWPWPLGVDSTDLGAPDSDVGLAIGMAVVGFVVVIAIARVALRYERRQETISDPI